MKWADVGNDFCCQLLNFRCMWKFKRLQDILEEKIRPKWRYGMKMERREKGSMFIMRLHRDAGAGGAGGGFSPPPLFPANKEIYIILQNNCLSMKFQFLLSMWPTILRSISSHHSGMKFEIFFSKYRCMYGYL